MGNWRSVHDKTEKETAWLAPRITLEQAAVINKATLAQVPRAGGEEGKDKHNHTSARESQKEMAEAG